jgi:hypothetical protein
MDFNALPQIFALSLSGDNNQIKQAEQALALVHPSLLTREITSSLMILYHSLESNPDMPQPLWFLLVISR